ncbi:MAG TPA: Dyp-type peroxidase [Kofleriaceae bacterium]|jgi:putative iron-dependent peroxidase|nr:Dyp-type peroxidase [Kofleriaceae bacterium]
MATTQIGILAPLPRAANYVTLALAPGASPRDVLERVRALRVDEAVVVGLGAPLVGDRVDGLRAFPAYDSPAGAIPSTQAAVFVQGRGDDAGASLRAVRRVIAALGPGLVLDEDIAAYKHDIGRDLSGYEDGTENPKGDAAVTAAVGASGASFVAAQRWVHDLDKLEQFDARVRDELIGRNRETNEELDAPPARAHTKRSEQESFDPPAFMVRRSMPFGGVRQHGLYFVAYVATLDTFERMMQRMAGVDDGVVDGLFQFSRPVSGGYYWCPPVDGGHLDLRALR